MIAGGHVVVMVSDMERAIAFYRDVLGLTLEVQDGDSWAELTTPGLRLGLHRASEHGSRPGQAGATTIGFDVEDMEAARRTLEERGVVLDGPITEDGVRLSFFADPDGNPLTLAQARE